MLDVENNLKLVIPTMSATYGSELLDKLQTKYPEKKIMYYYGLASDIEKRDVEDIFNKWKTCDVVIYSPTIEAGVSFDCDHFDRLYGFMCKSCTVSSFYQMLSRVRKFRCDDFYLFSELKYIPTAKIWTFEEIDNQSTYKQDSVLQNEYVYHEDSDDITIVRKMNFIEELQFITKGNK